MWAVLSCLLWLVGFDVLPALHLSLHELLEHHHHGVEEHPAQDSPSEHGSGSVAHRDLAAQASPVSIPPVPDARLAWAETASRTIEAEPRPVEFYTHRARGPPHRPPAV